MKDKTTRAAKQAQGALSLFRSAHAGLTAAAALAEEAAEEHRCLVAHHSTKQGEAELLAAEHRGTADRIAALIGG